MLRKRTRSTRKEQQMGQLTSDSGSDGCLKYGVAGQKQKTSSFFNLPGLFIGLSPKGVPDCDSVRSPTSPLDFKLLSNLGSSFRSPRCSLDGHHKTWDCSKVGLGIVDSLDDGGKLSGKGTGSTNIKSILFAPQIKTKTPNPDSPTHFSSSEAPKSLPKNCAVFPRTHFRSHYLQKGSSDLLFETGEDLLVPNKVTKFRSFSLDSQSFGGLLTYGLTDHGSGSDSSRNSGLENAAALVQEGSPSKVAGGSPPNLEDTSPKKPSVAPVVVGLGSGVVGHLSPSDIELSEDYTCVVSHGPNPKTTHIYGDCILECHPGETDLRATRGGVDIGIHRLGKWPELPTSYPSDEFLSFCYFCKKKLDKGKDIFMYRGEKAFCSSECRLEEISIDEWKDKSGSESHGRRGQF